jgi:uncharacterized membrane protein (UPF0136 family)
MQNKSLVIFIYAALVLCGGLIGFIVAGSLASIIASSIFTALLLIGGYFVSRGNKIAYDITLFVILFLAFFFGYRFFQTYQLPGGIMAVISALTFGYLVSKRNQA